MHLLIPKVKDQILTAGDLSHVTKVRDQGPEVLATSRDQDIRSRDCLIKSIYTSSDTYLPAKHNETIPSLYIVLSDVLNKQKTHVTLTWMTLNRGH